MGLSANQSKFKAKSSTLFTLEEIAFLLEIVVNEKEAKNSFNTIKKIFHQLEKVALDTAIPKTQIKVCDPSQTTQSFQKFEIQSESGLKDKMNISLEVCVIISFDKSMDFWEKGLSLSLTIDALESFCEVTKKEKNVFIWLESATIPKEEKEVSGSTQE